MPPQRKKDQSAPTPVSPTGVPQVGPDGLAARAQAGDRLTTSQGVRLPDTDHTLKAGARGPSLPRSPAG